MTSDEYYSNRDRRLDTVAGNDYMLYWSMIIRMSNDFKPGSVGLFGVMPEFIQWCVDNHGFRPTWDDLGGISGTPVILDERKYALCLLKYSG